MILVLIPVSCNIFLAASAYNLSSLSFDFCLLQSSASFLSSFSLLTSDETPPSILNCYISVSSCTLNFSSSTIEESILAIDT